MDKQGLCKLPNLAKWVQLMQIRQFCVISKDEITETDQHNQQNHENHEIGRNWKKLLEVGSSSQIGPNNKA